MIQSFRFAMFYQKGLTIIELMIVLLVAAILLSLAAPSMDSLLKSSSIRAYQTDLLNSVALARGEAVSRNKRIAMCASDNGDSCGGVWSNGWLVFIDDGAGANAGNGALDAGEEILRAVEYDGRNSISFFNTSSVAVTSLSWNFRGFTRHTTVDNPSPEEAATVAILCGPNGDAMSARAVLIELSGRAIKSRDLDGDGIHDTAFTDTQNATIGCVADIPEDEGATSV